MSIETADNTELQVQKEKYEKYQERYLNKSRELASKYLQELDELPGQPEEYAYFKNILRKVFIDNEVVKYSDEEKLIGSFCVTMPSEVIHAAGARPLKLCSSSYVGFHIGDYITPRDVCPLIKSVVGNVIGGISEIYKSCDMYVVPVACDCKKKLTAQLSDFKPTMSLYLPLNRSDDAGMDTYVKEVINIADKISEITGIPVTRESLGREIKKHAEVQHEIKRFTKLKNAGGVLIRGAHSLAVMNSLAYDDIYKFGEHLKKLNDELEERKNRQVFLTKKRLPRILLTGSPITFPNMKIPLIIEEQGGIIVADETCLGDRGTSDLVAVCDDSLNGYYRALANRYLRTCSCPIFPDNEPRIHKLEKMVKEGHIDGIVYHVLRGCLVYDYEYEKIEKYFSAKGIPVIRLESDYNEEDIEQLRIRIEAFIEMIKFKKKTGEGK